MSAKKGKSDKKGRTNTAAQVGGEQITGARVLAVLESPGQPPRRGGGALTNPPRMVRGAARGSLEEWLRFL